MQKRNLFFVLFTLVLFSFASVFAQDPNIPPPKILTSHVMNGEATSLPQPIYPAAARAVKAQGVVNVQVLIDQKGNVESAQAVSGHPLLRRSAEDAAFRARFKPTSLDGQNAKLTGVIVYKFIPNNNRERSWESYGISFGFAETNGIGDSFGLPEKFSNEQEQLNQLKQSNLWKHKKHRFLLSPLQSNQN